MHIIPERDRTAHKTQRQILKYRDLFVYKKWWWLKDILEGSGRQVGDSSLRWWRPDVAQERRWIRKGNEANLFNNVTAGNPHHPRALVALRHPFAWTPIIEGCNGYGAVNLGNAG
jgi:hypothetical protein